MNLILFDLITQETANYFSWIYHYSNKNTIIGGNYLFTNITPSSAEYINVSIYLRHSL